MTDMTLIITAMVFLHPPL